MVEQTLTRIKLKNSYGIYVQYRNIVDVEKEKYFLYNFFDIFLQNKKSPWMNFQLFFSYYYREWIVNGKWIRASIFE